MVKKLLVGILLVLGILIAGNAYAATIHVSQPTYVTDNANYDRNPSPFFDGTNYWVFYTKADSGSIRGPGYNPDGQLYTIYYKTASTTEGLAAATETQIALSSSNRPAGFSQRVASGVVFNDGNILVIASSGQDRTEKHIYTYSYNLATTTWSGPTQIITSPWGTQGGHVRTVYNGTTIYLVLEGTDLQSYIIKSTDRGVTWTSPVLVSSDNQPSIAIYGGVLYVVSIGDGAGNPVTLWTSTDDGATWVSKGAVNGLEGFYDPNVFFHNGALTVVSAPYVIPPTDRQYLMISQSPDSGLTWSSKKYLTNGGYGITYWWDYWPAGLSVGANTYLFYTTEKNGQLLGDGEIAFLKLDWDITENHFEAIQPAVAYASNGDTIAVAAGTYTETIKLVNPNGLIVIGDASNRPVINGGINFANTGDIIGITFENLILKGDAVPGTTKDIISMDNSGAVYDLKIKNCVLDGEKVDARNGINGNMLGGTLSITNTEFKDIWSWAVADIDSSTATGLPYGANELPFTGIVFANNNIHECDGTVALRGNNVDRTNLIQIYGNTIQNIGGNGASLDQHWAAIEVNNADKIEAYDNTITHVTKGEYEGQAFQFWNIGEIDIHDNTITDNFQGIFFFGGSAGGDYGGPYAVPIGSLYNNIFSGNIEYALSVEATNTGGPLIAESNWWGAANGPSGVGAGTGDSVSDNVDFSPWCTDAGCTATKDIFVGTGGFATIQAAINAANPGDTIYLGDGTFAEHIIISKPLTITHSSSPVVECVGGGNGIEVNADDVTIDGIEIRACSNGIVVNGNNFHATNNQIHANTVGIYVKAGFTATVINNNGIYSNTNHGVYNEGTNLLNAELNWWGDVSGPKHSTNPSGTGDVVTDNIDFDPWLCSLGGAAATDNDADGYRCEDDCDDANPNIYTGATEICNSVDDNCDGFVDETSNANDCIGTCEIYYASSSYTWTGHGGALNCCGNDAGEAGPYEAIETSCDGRDNNCDGTVDEGVKTTYYRDSDSDTYGDPSSTLEACSVPTGYVTDNTDCDDTNAAINPGASEICNGIDDNCDGNAEAGVPTTFYRDADVDGYGNPLDTTTACILPAGYLLDSNDCDDNNVGVHPGAIETCNNIDDDCDATIDEVGAVGCIDYYNDGDGDTYGTASKRCLCAPAVPYTAAVDSDCVDTNDQIHPNAAEACDGIDNNCNSQIDEGFADTDNDGQANCVDLDDDNDGVLDVSDNCIFIPNLDQADNDLDGSGNACDNDDDNDGILDVNDNCQFTSNPSQLDTDLDGQGDACDGDDDGDGIIDVADNCQTTPNPDQADLDGDGLGDVCDGDKDGDGIPNGTDPFPEIANRAPITQITAPAVHSYYNGIFAVTITDSDPDADAITCQYSIYSKRSGAWEQTTLWTNRVCSAKINATCLTEGYDYCEVHARARDKWGKLGNTSMRLFSLDWTGPNLRTVSPRGVIGVTKPLIEAAINDRGIGLNLAAVKLFLDNISTSATVTEAAVKYTPLTSLSDGVHFVRVEAKDKLNNSATLEWQFTVDTRLPGITIINPQHLDYRSRTQQVRINVNEQVKRLTAIKNNGVEFTLCTDCSSLTKNIVFDEGTNYLTIKAEDYAGNPSTAFIDFFVDSRAPVIQKTLPANGETIHGSLFTVRYSETELKQVRLKWREGAGIWHTETLDCVSGLNKECSIEINLTAYNSKTIEYYFEVEDKISTTASQHYYIKIDSTIPSVTINNPRGLYGVRSVLLDIKVAGESAGTLLEYSIDGKRAQRLCADCNSFYGYKSFGDGNHIFNVTATDKAGNKGYAGSKFTIDTTKPIIQKIEPTTAYFRGTFKVFYTESNLKQVTLYYGDKQETKTNCPQGINRECVFPETVAEGAKINYYFEVMDTAGNIARSSTRSVTMDTTEPRYVFAMITKSPRGAGINFNILLDEKVSKLSYNAGFGDKLLCAGCTAYNNRLSFPSGTYSITLKAEDYAGNINITKPVAVIV